MVDEIGIRAPVANLLYVPALGKLAENALYGPFGNADFERQFPNANAGSFGQAQQDMCMIGQKGPTVPLLRRFFYHRFRLPAEGRSPSAELIRSYSDISTDLSDVKIDELYFMISVT